MSNAINELEFEKVGKLLLKYSIPAVIGTVAVSLYNIADRVFIGQSVGALAISGLALTFPIVTLIQAFGTLVGVGASSRVSIVLGMKDKDWAENILGNSLILTLIFWGIITILSYFFLDEALLAFGGSEQTLPYAMEYLEIVIPASIFSNLCFSFSSIIRASGHPKKSMSMILLSVLINIILDPIFIFGFGWGIKGAAYATAISMFIAAFYTIYHFCTPQANIHFRRKAFKLRWKIIRNITAIGLSPFIMNFVASFVGILLNKKLLAEGGDLAIGAFGIINSYAVFFVMFIIGVCQGMQPIVGYNFGAGKLKRMKDTLFVAIKTAVLINTAGFLLAIIFPTLLAKVFTRDTELIQITAVGLRYVFLIFPLVAFQITIANFFQSIGKASLSIFMSLCRQVLFLLPALYILSHFFGLTGIWIASPISDLLSVIVAVLVFKSQKRFFYGSRKGFLTEIPK